MPYMLTTNCDMMYEMDERSNSQPKKFKEPAKNPITRPARKPGVIDAQW